MKIIIYMDNEIYKKEELTGVEPVTPRFAVSCSTAELQLLTEQLSTHFFLHSSRSAAVIARPFIATGPYASSFTNNHGAYCMRRAWPLSRASGVILVIFPKPTTFLDCCIDNNNNNNWEEIKKWPHRSSNYSPTLFSNSASPNNPLPSASNPNKKSKTPTSAHTKSAKTQPLVAESQSATTQPSKRTRSAML